MVKNMKEYSANKEHCRREMLLKCFDDDFVRDSNQACVSVVM